MANHFKYFGLCGQYPKMTICDACEEARNKLYEDLQKHRSITSTRNDKGLSRRVRLSQNCSYYLKAFILKNIFDESEMLQGMEKVEIMLFMRLQYRRLKESLIQDAHFLLLFNKSLCGGKKIEKASLEPDSSMERKIDNYYCIYDWRPRAKEQNTKVSTLLKEKWNEFINFLEYDNLLRIYPSIIMSLLNTSYAQKFALGDNKQEQKDFFTFLLPSEYKLVGVCIVEEPQVVESYNLSIKDTNQKKWLRNVISILHNDEYLLSCLIKPLNSKSPRILKMQVEEINEDILTMKDYILKFNSEIKPIYVTGDDFDKFDEEFRNAIDRIEEIRKYHSIEHINLSTLEYFIEVFKGVNLFVGDSLFEPNKAFSTYHFNKQSHLIDLVFVSNYLPITASSLYGFATKMFIMKMRKKHKVEETDTFDRIYKAKEKKAKADQNKVEKFEEVIDEITEEIESEAYSFGFYDDSEILKFHSIDYFDVLMLNLIVTELMDHVAKEKVTHDETKMFNMYDSYCDLILQKEYLNAVNKESICDLLIENVRMKILQQREVDMMKKQ
jgi:hypothetical protein